MSLVRAARLPLKVTEKLLEKLQALTDQPLQPLPPINLAQRFANFVSYEAYKDQLIQSHLQTFVGREDIRVALQTFMTQSPCGYFPIVGEAGMGKTAIAAWLTTKYRAAAYFFSRQHYGMTEAAIGLNYLSAQLCTHYNLPTPTFPSAPGPAAWLLATTLQQIPPRALRKKIVVILDALDEAADLTHLPEQLPEGIYFVVTYQPGYVWPTAIPSAVIAEGIELGAHNPEQNADIQAYLESAARQPQIQAWCAAQQPAWPSEYWVAQVQAASTGNFAYLTALLADLPNWDTFDWTRLPQGLQEYYTEVWRRLKAVQSKGRSDWRTLYRPVLGLLAVAGEPITATWLADLTGEPADEIIEWALQRWRGVLTVEETSQTWGFVHTSLADFVGKQLDLCEWHRQIAVYYLADTARWPAHQGYASRHLSRHLVAAGYSLSQWWIIPGLGRAGAKLKSSHNCGMLRG